MYHSLIFTNRLENLLDPSGEHETGVFANTWDDWHLIPSSRPVVAPPALNEKFIEIPGLDGSFDATDFLTGYPTFKDRTGSIKFYVANDYWNWEVAYTTIMSFLHGQRMYMMLEDDPSYFYEGRFSIDEWASEESNSTISIKYRVHPYKRSIITSVDDWLWDPFNFETGMIELTLGLEIGTSLDSPTEYTIVGSDEPVRPTFRYAGNGILYITYIYDGQEVEESFRYEDSPRSFPDILLRKGENVFRFYETGYTSSGNVSIVFRRGTF